MSSLMDVATREEQKPFARFERAAVEDKAASLAAGHYVAKDVDYALVTPPYSKDVFKAKVSQWFENLKADLANGRIKPEWLRQYQEEYKAWKEGKELPLDGTPILGWAVISPAQQETLIRNGIRTVESLAQVNHEGQSRIGMGAIELMYKAQAWLQQVNDKGKATMELAHFRKQNDELKETVAALQKQVELLASQQGNVPPKPSIVVSDLIEAGAPPQRPVPVPAVEVDLIAAYTAKFGEKPHHRMKRETIVAKLKE